MSEAHISDTNPDEEYHEGLHEGLQLTAVMTDDSDTTGVHFLIEKPQEECGPILEEEENEDYKKDSKNRTEQLDYMMQSDGSVICKLCGEVLQSRTQWYRHKYKLHVIHPMNPSPLFHCEQCRVYFKSRKGYIGHLSNKHSELLSDSSPVLTNSQIVVAQEIQPLQPVVQAVLQPVGQQVVHPVIHTVIQPVIKLEPDPELSIPTTSVPNYQNTAMKQTCNKSTETKRPCRTRVTEQPNTKDWEEKRSQEEKLVADIIERVRRECEATGPGPARRGYSRRTTVMNS